MDCSMPGFPVPRHLLEFAQIHVRWIGNAIQPPHPLSFSSPYKHLIMTYMSIMALPPLHSYLCTISLWVETGIFKVFHRLVNSNTYMSHSYIYKLHTCHTPNTSNTSLKYHRSLSLFSFASYTHSFWSSHLPMSLNVVCLSITNGV